MDELPSHPASSVETCVVYQLLIVNKPYNNCSYKIKTEFFP